MYITLKKKYFYIAFSIRVIEEAKLFIIIFEELEKLDVVYL